jgi:hypothetical protein
MIKVEIEKVKHDPSIVLNLSLGVQETKMLDSVIDKILVYPHIKDNDPEHELKLEYDENIFLMNLARKIGQSGMRQYIESEV